MKYRNAKAQQSVEVGAIARVIMDFRFSRWKRVSS
jgi:hypothetical protein